MKVALIPANEELRLDYLTRLQVLDTVAEQTFDDVTKIASHICGTPIALVSLVDAERQWFKSKVGLDADETPRDVAFCSHAILQDGVFVVEDSLADERFHDNPLATAAPHVRFYAGMPLKTEDGLGLGTLCVIDNKPRKLDEVQLECLRGLARQILREFELRLVMNELRRIDQMKNDFISTVNHELRTPLTSIRGALSLVNSGQIEARPAGKVGQLLDVAERNSLHLLSLVNDLLDMQKIEAGMMELKREVHEFGEIVDAAVEMNGEYVAAQGCTLEWQASEAPTAVPLDRCRIIQVIANFVSNAAKFSPQGSAIRLVQQTVGDRVRFEVVDTGCGIPLPARARIFDRFVQVDAEDTKSVKGTGLGLPISKKLIEMHGGTIGFTSTEGEGSTFYFELPLAERPVATT